MPDRCKSCGVEIIKSPISKISFWEGKTFDSRFRWEAFKPKNIIWKGLFKPDWFALSFILILLYLSWAYDADLDQYRDISENPCGFCANAARACSYNQNTLSIKNPIQIEDDPFENIDLGKT